jgi:hypothetical protein
MRSTIPASVSAVLRLAVWLAAAFLVAGCAGDDDSERTESTTGTADDAFVVGVVDDAVREEGRGAQVMEQLADAGFRAVRVASFWDPGETEPAADELAALRRVVERAGEHDVRVYLHVYHGGSQTTPFTAAARSEFAAYAAALAREVPEIRDVIVGNEPNINRFWLPQFGPDGEDVAAPAYLELLAETYDALKAVSGDVLVYGGVLGPRGIDRPNTGRDTQSPTAFIRDLGAAYRASGRDRPVMDAFAFHPYAERSDVPPDRPHPRSTTIGLALADYEKLVALLREAFDGTAQPSGADLPILYDEFGVETAIRPEKAALYEGEEPTTHVVDEATQGRYYRRAIQLAACSPNVAGILLFHSHDEPVRAGWQSGVYFVDGSAKDSLEAVRAAALGVRKSRC